MEFRCPECGEITPAKGKFCKECGYSLQRPTAAPINYSIPQSYTPKHLAEKILTTRSSLEGERKLVTVMFAVVAGFTALSEKLDPEDVHRIMDGCCRILVDEIHRLEGTANPSGDQVARRAGNTPSHWDGMYVPGRSLCGVGPA